MDSWGWIVIGLLGISLLIGGVLLINGLTRFNIEDDFDQRER